LRELDVLRQQLDKGEAVDPREVVRLICRLTVIEIRRDIEAVERDLAQPFVFFFKDKRQSSLVGGCRGETRANWAKRYATESIARRL
jgi:hypothetical protein